MEKQEHQRIAAALARNAATEAQISESIVSTWQEIDVALRPIIGQRGVVLLYKRSIHLVSPAHAWLTGVQDTGQDSMDLTALGAAFAQQDSTQAAAGGGLLLQTFYQLLSSLIGSSLTEQLLRPVWDDLSSDPPSQDPTT